MPIVNLTNVTVRLADESGDVYATFEPSGDAVTIHSNGQEHEVDGVPVEVTRITAVDGLPEPEDGTFYIVPQPVAQFSRRPDFVTPDTGPSAILDDDQKVYATRRLFSVTRTE